MYQIMCDDYVLHDAIIDELKVEDERSEKSMASLVQCDFCKKTFSRYDL